MTATHLRGERSHPVSTAALIGEHAHLATPGPGLGAGSGGPGALAVLLGPASEVGRAVLAKRPDVARAILDQWAALIPAGSLFLEIVNHRGPYRTPGSCGQAAGMLALAHDAGIPAVLTNAVRYATANGAVTADVLDAARRLVVLDSRHLDRTTDQGLPRQPRTDARSGHRSR